MTLNRTPSSPWAFNSHSNSRTAIHSFNRSNVMWHVYELFCPACCIFKKLEVLPHWIHWRRMCHLQGNMHKHIWQHAIQVLGEQRKGHFLAHQIDSVLPLEIQLTFFSLYWARTPSEYHNGTPVRSPMNLHCIRYVGEKCSPPSVC